MSKHASSSRLSPFKRFFKAFHGSRSLTLSFTVQLSTLATQGGVVAVKHSVAAFVERNDRVRAAGLFSVDDASLASYGEIKELGESGGIPTSSRFTVPIYNGIEPWGKVIVSFERNAGTDQGIVYFGFVLLLCFVSFALFLRKILMQLDPAQVVPKRVDSAFNLFSEGVVILDDELRIMLVNQTAAAAVGKSSNQLIGTRLDDWPWQREEGWQAPWVSVRQTGQKISDYPMRLESEVDAEDEFRFFMVSCATVGEQEAGDSQRGVLVPLDDMTVIEHKNLELAGTLHELRQSQADIQKKNRELEALASRDPLTGLANRRSMMEDAGTMLFDAKREKHALACIMTDIDHFKSINDTYGHGVGDDVIRGVADVLVDCSRESDTVCRYGGEEFAILMPGTTQESAEIIAERMRKAILTIPDAVEIPIDGLSSSFGIAMLDDEVEGVESLLDRAAQALYVAKEGGRNQYFVYDKERIAALGKSEGEEKVQIHALGRPSLNSDRRVKQLEAIVEQRTRDINKLRAFDALTGIPHRKLFLQSVQKEMQRSERLKTQVGILALEIRDWNRLVSSFGAARSDALLVEFVERLEIALRKADMVSDIAEDHCMSRIYSNEFGVLLSDLAEPQQVMPVVSRLRRELAKPFSVDGSSVYLGACMGIALSTSPDDDIEKLLEQANQACLEASKVPDKFSHRFASKKLDINSRRIIRIEADLIAALKENQFEVYYQPKFDLSTRQISGVEALLRWHHPEHGMVPPAEFIPVAEMHGLIHKISRYVFTESIVSLKQWVGLGFDDLVISVNVSAVQLRDKSLAQRMIEEIEEAGLNPQQFEVELTETAVIDRRDLALQLLEEWREAGLAVSMDDFGTGYTSLALLADLPLDTVKIDRSFVVAMDSSDRSRAIVESIINMAHALSLKVVGEGIETNAQLDALAALGCNEIQGYLISRPLTFEQATRLLLAQKRGNQAAVG